MDPNSLYRKSRILGADHEAAVAQALAICASHGMTVSPDKIRQYDPPAFDLATSYRGCYQPIERDTKSTYVGTRADYRATTRDMARLMLDNYPPDHVAVEIAAPDGHHVFCVRSSFERARLPAPSAIDALLIVLNRRGVTTTLLQYIEAGAGPVAVANGPLTPVLVFQS